MTSRTKEEWKIVKLYQQKMPVLEIAKQVFPTDDRYDHLRVSSIMRVLKRLGVRLRTPSERTCVGAQTRVRAGWVVCTGCNETVRAAKDGYPVHHRSPTGRSRRDRCDGHFTPGKRVP